MKKALKIILITLIILVAFLLLTVVVGTLFGGCATKNYVNNHSKELIGREAHVNRVGMNLFTGQVSILGLEVMEEDDTTTFAGFDTLDVSVSLLRLLGKRVQVRHFTLAGLHAHVMQDSIRFNFSSIIDHFQSDDDEAEQERDTTPSDWTVSIHRIRIDECSMLYEDLLRKTHIGFQHLRLLVPDIVIGGEEKTDADLTVAMAGGGELSANSDYDAATGNFNLKLGLNNFALDQIKPYLVDHTYIETVDGMLSLDATAQGNISHFIESSIAAHVKVNDVDVIDSSHVSVASLKQLDVDLGEMVLSQRIFDINSIKLDGLTAKYEMFADSTNTLSRLMAEATSDTTSPQADKADADEEPTPIDTLPTPPLQLHIGQVALHNINFTFADHTMPVDFVFPITNINVETVNPTTSGINNARMRADLPNGGTFIANWKGNLSNWKQYQDLHLVIKNLHLTDFSPYMITYFGMPFSEGIFGFTSQNTIQNSKLDGKNHIDIYKPNLGERQEGVKPKLKLPVRAALYVLKDKDDKVILDVPVKGNVDNPEFKYMKLVWKTLGNLIVKVATSPARLLANMGEGSEELFVAVDLKEGDLGSEQFYQIDQIADLAKNNDKVHLTFQLMLRPNNATGHQSQCERMDNTLKHHLKQLGLDKSQYSIESPGSDESVVMDGYAVVVNVIK